MAKPKTGRKNPALRLALIRQLHIWLSVFVAPSLIFFAVTGALQTFRIPDQKGASVLLVKLARVHRDDVFAVKPPRPKKPETPGKKAEAPPPKPAPSPATEAAKWFFAIVSVGIAISALLGLWMALAYGKNRWLLWLLTIAGAVIPVAILAAA